MSQAEEAFLAGSRSFTLALFGPLTESTGLRPRLAADPAQAMALCGGASGLLVVEAAPEWLPAVEHLRRQAPALQVVAAVAPGQEATGARLAALGAEPVAWDGQPGPLQLAAARAVAGRSSAGADPSAASGPAPAVELFTPAPGSAGVVPPLPAPAALHAPPPYQAPAPPEAPPAEALPAAPAWPSQAPDEDEAEAALVRTLRGKLPADAPLAPAATRAVAALSRLERQALAGEPLPFDAAPLYRAAVTRLRVSAALDSAPEPPAPVDHDAVQGLLGVLDEVLAQVNPLAAQVPETRQAELETVRNALVRVAVDFSEAAHRLGPVAASVADPAAAPHQPRLRAATKVLSVHAGSEPAAAPARRPVAALVTLALVALVTGAFHGWRWATTPTPQAPPTLAGAPANTLAVRNAGGQHLMAIAGTTVDRLELERFTAEQKARGNTVRELAPGTWIIERAPTPAPGSTP